MNLRTYMRIQIFQHWAIDSISKNLWAIVLWPPPDYATVKHWYESDVTMLKRYPIGARIEIKICDSADHEWMPNLSLNINENFKNVYQHPNRQKSKKILLSFIPVSSPQRYSLRLKTCCAHMDIFGRYITITWCACACVLA